MPYFRAYKLEEDNITNTLVWIFKEELKMIEDVLIKIENKWYKLKESEKDTEVEKD